MYLYEVFTMTISAICAGNPKPERHQWRRMAAVGWFRCTLCKVPGVCVICLQRLGKPIPTKALKLTCPQHTLTNLP
jgi:hypothetical protein